MATLRKSPVAPKNIKVGTRRKKPGSTGKGAYYRIEVLPRGEFVRFRTQDVGKPGHIQRLAGRRSNGSWATASWLISKQDAHRRAGRLVADSREAVKLLTSFGSSPIHTRGDRFRVRPVTKSRKRPPASRRVRRSSIRKAKPARLKRKKF